MDHLEEQRRARDAISTLFDVLKIRTVCFVDDRFRANREPEAMVAWLDEAHRQSPDEVRELFPGLPFAAPGLGWVEEFRTEWAGMEEDQQSDILVKLFLISEDPNDADSGQQAALRDFIPDRFELLEIGPQEWLERRDDILARASTETRVLCLFDQDLSHAAGGFTATGTRSGIGLLKEVSDNDDVICALLSHLFPMEAELDEWRRFADENGLELSRFLPVSKRRLHAPVAFVAALKKTALNRYTEGMKAAACKLFKEASTMAAEKLRDVDPYEFDHMVLRSSLKEGVSEVDTLLRIYHILQRDYAKQEFLKPEQAEEFQRIVTATRPISRIGGDDLHEDRYDQRRAIRHRELYERRALVNGLHAPLRNGDLFGREDDDDPTFILLVQPCDAMVRSNGKRGFRKENAYGVFVALSRKPHDYELETHEHRLPNLYPDTPDFAVADLRDSHVVHLYLLDLCALNADGSCAINLEALPDEPPQFHRAWQMRRKRLIKKYQALADRLDSLQPALTALKSTEDRDALQSRILPSVILSDQNRVKVSYQDRRFDFGVRRMGRLRSPSADRLLRDHMRWHSREADLHDFAD